MIIITIISKKVVKQIVCNIKKPMYEPQSCQHSRAVKSERKRWEEVLHWIRPVKHNYTVIYRLNRYPLDLQPVCEEDLISTLLLLLSSLKEENKHSQCCYCYRRVYSPKYNREKLFNMPVVRYYFKCNLFKLLKQWNTQTICKVE